MENELVFIGSPETVARKLRNAAEIGFFNTFMGEFNFADLPEPELMRSIKSAWDPKGILNPGKVL